MIAAVFTFPSSFLCGMQFIFKGNTGWELLNDFNDVQLMEPHCGNVCDQLNFHEEYDKAKFAESIYDKFRKNEPVTADEVKEFFELCPDICTMQDLTEVDNAVELLAAKYPEARYRY